MNYPLFSLSASMLWLYEFWAKELYTTVQMLPQTPVSVHNSQGLCQGVQQRQTKASNKHTPDPRLPTSWRDPVHGRHTLCGRVLSGGASWEVCEEDSNAGDCHSLLQAFSHYTWDKSKSLLVCDLKGCKVQEELVLTDPTVHSRGCGRKYGCLDKGSEGVRRFFEAHTCSDYCKSMKLPPPDLP